MRSIKVLTGNWAAAYGAKLARVDFVSAYPITPQTSVIEKLAEFIDKGELKAKMVRVESEHSAMAAVIGAAAVGARAFTATSAQGLFYMYEMVWWAAGARLPIVMGIVTRALAPPWSIWTDHADFLALRDSGWILLFARNAQEVLDTIIQAYRIAEDEDVVLPVAVGWDAFIASHTAEPVDVPEQDVVDEYLPKKTFSHMLDVDNPFSLGNLAFPDSYMEYRWLIDRAMNAARKVIIEADREFGEFFGRSYGGLIEKYRCEDADVVIVMMGASSGDGMDAVDVLRDRGYRTGLCRIRAVRPFPVRELREVARTVDAVLVIDRAVSFGIGGTLGSEVKAALYPLKEKPLVLDFIAGLGGRDIDARLIERLVLRVYDVLDGRAEAEEVEWIGLDPEVIKA